MYKLYFTAIILFSFVFSQAQSLLNIGVEYQIYPAGHIIGTQAEFKLAETNHALNIKIAANIADRKNFSGLNDDEKGYGPGATIGYRYYFSKGYEQGFGGLFLGIRTDFWRLKIDWKDSTYKPTSGTTKISVLQPTAEIGFKFELQNNFNISVGLVNGFEINVSTDGKEVGQGFITLGQLIISKRF